MPDKETLSLLIQVPMVVSVVIFAYLAFRADRRNQSQLAVIQAKKNELDHAETTGLQNIVDRALETIGSSMGMIATSSATIANHSEAMTMVAVRLEAAVLMLQSNLGEAVKHSDADRAVKHREVMKGMNEVEATILAEVARIGTLLQQLSQAMQSVNSEHDKLAEKHKVEIIQKIEALNTDFVALGQAIRAKIEDNPKVSEEKKDDDIRNQSR